MHASWTFEMAEQMNHKLKAYKSVVVAPRRFTTTAMSDTMRKARSEADVSRNKVSAAMNAVRNTLKKRLSKDDEELSVSVVEPMASIEWDPSCLLEDLYSDHRLFVHPDVANGDHCRYKGFLNKLPVGQNRATVVKGWKQRYFKVKEGSLFYYESREDVKALGRLSLEKCTVTLDVDQLAIVDGNGRVLMLRGNRDELVLWKRALLLESVHPTIMPPSSSSPCISDTVIIDIGSCSVRAGYVTDNTYPQLYFPCVFTVDSHTKKITGVGMDALVPERRGEANMVLPWKHSARMDKQLSRSEYLYTLVSYVFSKLGATPAECSVILAISHMEATDDEKQMIGEVLFDQIGVQSLLLQDQAVLALYSYGAVSGIVVDIGDRCDVVPIIDGCKVDGGAARLPFGGNAVTDSLTRLSTEKGVRYFSDTEAYVMRYVKETIAYVSQDYDADLRLCGEAPAEFARVAEVAQFHLPDHRVLITLDSALFRAAEGHFQPSIWGKDAPTIHALVWKGIQACPVDERKNIASQIYLSGAATLLTGFQERLEKELFRLAPVSLPVKVHGSETRAHAAFIGAGVLASLQNFQSACVNSSEWYSQGCRAFTKS